MKYTVATMLEKVMARSERFELPALGIEIRCSIQLSYERFVNDCNDLVAISDLGSA
jgi:hypothetical protein